MDEMPGMIRPDLQALPQVRDRMTFLYLELAQACGQMLDGTFPRTRGGDLKGKRRMVFLPGRLVTDRKAAADEKSGCTNSMEKVYARLHVAIYEILYYHKSASDLSLVRRGGTPKIRFFPVEFPTVHLMRIER